tara:strand:+ start:69 stop:329 length:261 start_codon:yes stop_codon:yes gene_type:complete
MGRVVLTHSTYIDGLVNWAKKLAKHEEIQTITPGAIGRTRANSSKFLIRVSRKLNSGYKLIARKGKSYQEIYIVTGLKYEDLLKLI